MRNDLASAAEAKIGALFLNGQEALPIHVTLAELGHPQPPMPMQTGNYTAEGFANNTIKQKRSKAINMRLLLPTGSKTTSVKSNSSSIGGQVPKTLETTIPSITLPVLTAPCGQHISLVASTFQHNVLRGCVNSPIARTRAHAGIHAHPPITYQDIESCQPLTQYTQT
jgi:hypothetical protein